MAIKNEGLTTQCNPDGTSHVQPLFYHCATLVQTLCNLLHPSTENNCIEVVAKAPLKKLIQQEIAFNFKLKALLRIFFIIVFDLEIQWMQCSYNTFFLFIISCIVTIRHFNNNRQQTNPIHKFNEIKPETLLEEKY